tara:strand:+ start:431 stop:535 length:105 start_codon:yes stop_codon:yes gene_type:complete
MEEKYLNQDAGKINLFIWINLIYAKKYSEHKELI